MTCSVEAPSTTTYGYGKEFGARKSDLAVLDATENLKQFKFPFDTFSVRRLSRFSVFCTDADFLPSIFRHAFMAQIYLLETIDRAFD